MKTKQPRRLSLVLSAAMSLSSFAIPMQTGMAQANNVPASQQFVDSVENLLGEFNSDPKAFMQKNFLKQEGQNSQQQSEKFTRQYVNQQTPNQFVEGKDEWRIKIFCGDDKECVEKLKKGEQLQGRAQFEPNDNPAELVDEGDEMLKTLDGIEKAGLMSAQLDETPWSDDYWAIYRGVLGARYASDEYPDGGDWRVYFNTVASDMTLSALWAKASRLNLDEFSARLSPSEKYDMLVGSKSEMAETADYWKEQLKYQLRRAGARNLKWEGDTVPQGILTPGNWLDGQYYQRMNDKVEPWMGICHGWAPAAYVMDRPEKAVTMTGADGKTKVKFYPADIKALSSYLFAQNNVQTRYIGGRCNTKGPKTDSATGRILDQECFDTNPGAWHLSIVNQIGKNKNSFVMDATFDYEVWNQPVHSYRAVYFDPVSGQRKTATEWKKVARQIFEGTAADKFKWATGAKAFNKENDKFWEFRFKKSGGKVDWNHYQRNPGQLPYYVVGVAMEVEYVVETRPVPREYDNADLDATKKVTYLYDLELNVDGEVIGGEWYNNAHPDFLWHVPQSVVSNKRYYTEFDQAAVGKWDGSGAMPASWQAAAKDAASNQKPLAKIVDVLIEKANGARSTRN